MAKRSSKDAKVIAFGGWDLRGFLTKIGYSREHTSESRFPMGERAEAHQPTGISRASITQAGWFDDSDVGTIEAFIAMEALKVPGLVNKTGGTQGSLTQVMDGVLVLDPGEQIEAGALVKWDQTFMVDGRIFTGQLSLPYTTITGNGSTNYTTGDGTTTDGAAICLMVDNFDLDTATALVLTVSEGTDPTYVQIATVTFNSDTDPHKHYYVEVPGTIGPDLKVAWAWTGGAGAGSTARIVGGVARLPAAA